MDPRAKDIMHTPVISVDKDVDLERVIQVMRKNNLSKLPVTEKGRLVGIVTDGLIADELGALKNRSLAPSHLHASSVMERDFPALSPDDPLPHIRTLFEGTQIGILPVTHETQVLGVITKADLLDFVLSERPVTEAMTRRVHAVGPDERVVHARRIMLDEGIERLPVLEEGRVVGVLAEMDVALAFEAMKRRVDQNHQQHHLKNLLVRDVMTAPVVTVGADATLAKAARIMREKDVGCLPVIDGKGIIQGLLTRSDLIRVSAGNGGPRGAGVSPSPGPPKAHGGQQHRQGRARSDRPVEDKAHSGPRSSRSDVSRRAGGSRRGGPGSGL